MRLVGGKYRGKILGVPDGMDTRPTSDRAREALFNILAHRYPAHDFSVIGARVLDLCAGTGALGLEALSRGAAHVTFVEQGAEALKVLQANVRSMKTPEQMQIIRGDATRLPRASVPCSLVFLDPPYADGIEAKVLMSAAAAGWISSNALVVVETDSKHFPEWPNAFKEDDRRTYGKSAFTLLRYGHGG